MSERQGAGREPDASGESPDPFEGLVLDEDFVKGAQKSEGSARARMLAAKWRENPPERVGFREAADTPRRRGRLRGPRTGRGSAGQDRSDRTGVKVAVVFVVVAALLLLGSNQGVFRDLFGGSNADDTASPRLPAFPQNWTASATPRAPERATRDQPFVGSPANGYNDGESGIVPPDATKVGDFSATEVKAALDTHRRLLVLGNLDATTLRGGYPQGFIDLIDPVDPMVGELRGALKTPTADHDPLAWITRFDPAQTELVGSVVKVTGIMAFRLDQNGGLVVESDYSFVYPVAKPGSSEVTRVVVRRTLQTQVYKSGKFRQTPPGTAWVSGGEVWLSGRSCERQNGYVQPAFPSDAGASGGCGSQGDPYDRTTPLLGGTGAASVAPPAIAAARPEPPHGAGSSAPHLS